MLARNDRNPIFTRTISIPAGMNPARKRCFHHRAQRRTAPLRNSSFATAQNRRKAHRCVVSCRVASCSVASFPQVRSGTPTGDLRRLEATRRNITRVVLAITESRDALSSRSVERRRLNGTGRRHSRREVDRAIYSRRELAVARRFAKTGGRVVYCRGRARSR